MEKNVLPKVSYKQIEGNEYLVGPGSITIRVVPHSNSVLRRIVEQLGTYFNDGKGSDFVWDDPNDYHAYLFAERKGVNWGWQDPIVGVILMRKTGHGASGWVAEWAWFFSETASALGINSALTRLVGKYPPSYLVRKPIDPELRTVLVARGVDVDVDWPVVS